MASEVQQLIEWACGVPYESHQAVSIANDMWIYGYRVDRGNPDGGNGPLRNLRRLGIRQARLVKLFQLCKHKYRYFHAVLRAESLGILTAAELNSAIDHGTPLDLNDLLTQVQKQLPEFGLEDI